MREDGKIGGRTRAELRSCSVVVMRQPSRSIEVLTLTEAFAGRK